MSKLVFRKFLENNIQEILVALLLSATLFFFAPVSVYIENAKFLQFNLADIWYFYFLVTLIVFLILFAVILLLKHVFSYIALLFTALSVGFILQGHFLISDLGVLDGHEIAWDSFGFKPFFELIIWIIIIAGFLLFRRSLYRQIASIQVLLIIFQLGTIAIGILNNPIPQNNGGTYFDTEKELEFSQEKNVIVIILDTFRSEAFRAVLDRYPEYRVVFQDFIYFQDAVGGYPTTRPSVPLILTGEFYDNSIPISQFITETERKILPYLLKKNGFIIENFSLVPYYGSVYDNLTYHIPFNIRESIVRNQYLVAGIRYMPLFLKGFFVTQYYQGQDYYHKDMVEFANRLNKTKVTDLQPTFKLYHFSGAHPPFQLDNELNRTDKGYIEQAAASLKIVKELIKNLKEAGGYDNSLILIVGDHGSHNPWEYDGTSIAYNTQVLMLAKPVGQQLEEIQFSDSRVSLGDIPKSVAEELGIENSYPGYSIFEPVPADRLRRFFFYRWSHSDWSSDYLPVTYEFEIRGSADQWGSYTLLKEHGGNGDTDGISLAYQYGENIVDIMLANEVYRWFHSKSFDYEIAADGRIWVWASGPEACIQVSVETVDREMSLSIIAKPFLVQNQLEDQRMVVSIDQHLLATFQKNDTLETTIPSELAEEITRDSKAEICFEFPDATKSPKDYGYNNDPRLLGYTFTSIILK
jgi:hypothetical protein